jgi:Protein of unknown function (DUF3810)
LLKLAVIFVAALLALTPLPRHTVERMYSRGLYPIIQPRLTALSNSTPFAWFDAVLLLTAGSVIVLCIMRVRHRKTGIARIIGGLLLDTMAIAAVLYLWFLGSWGLNYQRQPLREQLDFREDRITREGLRALASRTIEALNALHGGAHAAGWPELAATPNVLDDAFVQAQRDLALTWTARPARPKRTVLNFYFTRVSIDGMTNPFFLETLTNQTLLPFERAATVAHEWSHLAGYADESEANFVGWLVCMRGTESLQYSGWLSLYGTIFNALPRFDRDDISARLEHGPRADLQAISARIRKYQIRAANRAGYALYDRFLKANRVEAGVRSYGEVLRLLLGTKFNEDGSPVMRK